MNSRSLLPSLSRRGRRPSLSSPWFDDFFEDFNLPADWAGAQQYGFAPSCEVKEKKHEYIFKVDLPGVHKEDIRIDVTGNQLTVSGERREEKEEGEDEKSRVSETFYGAYSRSFTLPASVESEKIDAKYKDGVLTLHVPKSEKAKAREIKVQ